MNLVRGSCRFRQIVALVSRPDLVRLCSSAFSSILVLLWLGLNGANAQPVDAPPLFAEGLVPASPESLKGIPFTPTYRAFLPRSADLSYLFPTVGDQKSQASCVAWAVGYAARAY